MSNITIRVYGILIDEEKRILVSDEFIRGMMFTKFPGGGLEFGEGTKDCVKREFMEEVGIDVTVGKHFYTTDYFQISGFNNSQQIISIYYFVSTNNIGNINTSTKSFNFTTEQLANKTACYESLRWIEWHNFNEQTVHLPIDKIVAKMLKEDM